MEQFSLEKYLKNPSRKVVTKDGRSVRIVCTDAKVENYPIVAIIRIDENNEFVDIFQQNGECNINTQSNRDLFFAPEKKEGYINLFKQTIGFNTGFVFNTKKEAEKSAKGLSGYITTIKIEWEE